MSSPKKVAFRLAPLVHLYKRRTYTERLTPEIPVDDSTAPVAPSAPSFDTLSISTDNVFMNSDVPPPPLPPPPLSTLLGPNWWLKNDESVDEPLALRISVPPPSNLDLPPSTLPSYDDSPLSPKTHFEIAVQRNSESYLRKQALADAITNFQCTLTPYSERTPASVVMNDTCGSMSPLNLMPFSPKSSPTASNFPILPRSADNSSCNLVGFN